MTNLERMLRMYVEQTVTDELLATAKEFTKERDRDLVPTIRRFYEGRGWIESNAVLVAYDQLAGEAEKLCDPNAVGLLGEQWYPRLRDLNRYARHVRAQFCRLADLKTAVRSNKLNGFNDSQILVVACEALQDVDKERAK